MKLKRIIILLIAFAIMGSAIAGGIVISKLADSIKVNENSSNSNLPGDSIVSDVNGSSNSLSNSLSFSSLLSYSIDVSESNVDDYKFCAVRDVKDGNQSMLGITLSDLKPNTKYRIDWVINPALYKNTGMSIRYQKDINQYEIYLDTDYVPNTGLGKILTMGAGKSFDGLLENSWTFTSANEGSCFTFFFAHAQTDDLETLEGYADIVAENFSFRLYVVEE